MEAGGKLAVVSVKPFLRKIINKNMSLGKGNAMEASKRNRRGDSRQVKLRGDVIRKRFERGGHKLQSVESYSEFFARVDARSEILESRDWLSNKDDVSFV